MKFVPAVARLLCLALPGFFLTMFAQNKGALCTEISNPRRIFKQVYGSSYPSYSVCDELETGTEEDSSSVAAPRSASGKLSPHVCPRAT